MEESLNWDDITNLYRKRPARFKALQFEEGMLGFPDSASEGDWLVMDLENNKTHLIEDKIFNLIFESDY